MGKLSTSVLFISLLFASAGCLIKESPKATSSDLLVARGDIVVASLTSDSLVVFSPDGTFKRVLYTLPNTVGDAIAGLAWNSSTNEVLVSIDGTPDRIEAVSVVTGQARNFYNNTNFFTGTPLAAGELRDTGDIVVSEGATIERFSSNGQRETHTTIWPTSVFINAQAIVGLSSGQWLACSSTAGLRLMNDSTTSLAAVSTATGAIAGTTATFGCGELSNGNIIVAWNGTTDTIQTYSSTLTGATTVYSNTGVIGDPRGLAVGENDEVYVSDGTRNVIVEIDVATGSVVNEFGLAYLNGPRSLIVIPEFN
jgi:hypothetical protein